jgi:hypothetical protein
MNALEIRALEVTPAVVNFNFEEIKEYAEKLSADYKTLVFDDSSMKECKKTLAEVRKIPKNIDAFRMETVNAASPSLNKFVGECKEIKDLFSEVILKLDEKVKKYEDEQKRLKQLKIESVISQGYEQAEIEPKFQTVEFKSDWLNATKSEKDIVEEIRSQLVICANNQNIYYQNVELIHTLVDLANQKYSLAVPMDPARFMLDNESIDRIKEMITSTAERQQQSELNYKAKIEAQAQAQATVKAAEIISQVTEQFDKIIPIEKQESDPLYERTIKVKGTKAQLQALKSYLEQVGIEVLS